MILSKLMINVIDFFFVRDVSDLSSMAIFRNVNVFLVLRLASRERAKKQKRTNDVVAGARRSAYES